MGTESSSEVDYYNYSDRDSLDGLDNDEAEVQWAPLRAPSCKVVFVVGFGFVCFVLWCVFWFCVIDCILSLSKISCFSLY